MSPTEFISSSTYHYSLLHNLFKTSTSEDSAVYLTLSECPGMPRDAQNLHTCKARQSGLLGLSLDLFHMILDQIIIAQELKKVLRLRLVNKLLATEILPRLCKPGSFDMTKEVIFDNWRRRQSMSRAFKVGLLLPRLNLSYAVQSHYLSSILQAEELLLERFPDDARKQRHDFRHALCAAELWRFLDLGNIEPIFPQAKPSVEYTSPLADALSAAAFMGHMELVQKLLHEGADVNYHTGYLRSALQQAASRGHNDILLLLLSKGADIKLGSSRSVDPSDCGALYLASLNGHERTVELLLSHKHEIRADLLKSVDVAFAAIRGGHLNLIKGYLETEISTYVENKPANGYDMLYQAVTHDHEHLARWLLQNGVDITKNSTHGWDRSFTPLEIAALHGRPGMVRLLLEYSCKRLNPALASAAQNGHIEVAKLLLDTPGEVDVWSMLHGKTPFHKRTERIQTPLYLAVCKGEVEMVRFLLGRGIEKHFCAAQAASRGEEDILRLLLEAEARVRVARDYTKLLTWVRKQTHVPKRISDIILELCPITRDKDEQAQSQRSADQEPDPLNSHSTVSSSPVVERWPTLAL